MQGTIPKLEVHFRAYSTTNLTTTDHTTHLSIFSVFPVYFGGGLIMPRALDLRLPVRADYFRL